VTNAITAPRMAGDRFRRHAIARRRPRRRFLFFSRQPTAAYRNGDDPALRRGGRRLVLRHVSDHADEIDGTIAFASRGVDARAFAKATFRSPPLMA